MSASPGPISSAGPGATPTAAPDGERKRLQRLRGLLQKARGGLRGVSDAELLELMRLYRYAASRIAWHETRQADLAALQEARVLAREAHALLYRDIDRPREGWPRRVARFFGEEVPRTIRAEWKLLVASFVLVYGLSAVAYFAVMRDLELAYSLLDPGVVANEIEQLDATKEGEPFRGNFTFGVGESPQTAGWIMAHNMGVGVIFFSAALIPPLYVYVLSTNSLMLGTYTAVAGHWGQAGAISSILWCHGTLEIQAIILAGLAGLVMIRAWIAPGAWTRREAMSIESKRAWRILAAVFPMLFVAGLIEGFVSPHAPIEVRMLVAVLSGIALVAWIGMGGRARAPASQRLAARLEPRGE